MWGQWKSSISLHIPMMFVSRVRTRVPPPHLKDKMSLPLLWRHYGRDSVSNHQPHDCLLNRLIRRRSKQTSKLRVTGLCAGNSPGTSEFLAQVASNAENISIWWRHHVTWALKHKKSPATLTVSLTATWTLQRLSSPAIPIFFVQ